MSMDTRALPRRIESLPWKAAGGWVATPLPPTSRVAPVGTFWLVSVNCTLGALSRTVLARERMVAGDCTVADPPQAVARKVVARAAAAGRTILRDARMGR